MAELKVNVLRLEPIKLQVSRIQHIGVMELHRYDGYNEDELIYQLTAKIYAEDVGEYNYRVPKTKFDMFKLSVFPQWLLDKFPAEYTKKTVSFKALFPEYIPPGKFGRGVEFYELPELGPLTND